MPDEMISILSTRPLDSSIIKQASDHNIEINSVSFIRTEPIRNEILKKQIAAIFQNTSTVIFTSMNAAEAVSSYLEDAVPKWEIYCLGTATKKIVRQHFPQSLISGSAENASSLADTIVRNNENELIFFCGDQRRDELPQKLTDQNIILEEIIVYRTIATPEKISKDYDGILFFSPSAVESFFSLNTVNKNTILFAIGTTTAESIRRFSSNNIIQSQFPGKNNLAEKAISYFGKSKNTHDHIKK